MCLSAFYGSGASAPTRTIGFPAVGSIRCTENRDNATAGFRHHAAYLAGALFHALFSFFNEDSNRDGTLDMLSRCVCGCRCGILPWGGGVFCALAKC